MIDYDRLAVRRPELAWDLPGGARRLVQRADGYDATIKCGVVTVDHDELTGERPGNVIRGRKPWPFDPAQPAQPARTSQVIWWYLMDGLVSFIDTRVPAFGVAAVWDCTQ